MSETPDLFGELRSLLHDPGSRASPWQDLVALTALDEPRFLDALLPYAVELLEGETWRAQLRPVPSSWMQRMRAGEEVALIRMCDSLSLWHATLNDETLETMRKNPSHFDGIRHLTINNPVSEAHLEQLLSLGLRCRARTLSLHSNALPDEALSRLFAAPFLEELTTLTVTNTPLGAQSAQALATPGRLDALTRVTLRGCDITADTLEVLLRAPWAARLEQLDLSGFEHPMDARRIVRATPNLMGDEGVQLVASASHMRSLERLLIHRGELHDTSLIALSRAEHLSSLRTLELVGNRGISDSGLAHLADSPHLSDLQRLHLKECALTEASAQLMGDPERLPKLRELGLCFDAIHRGEELWYDWDGSVVGSGPRSASMQEIRALFFSRRPELVLLS